MWIGPRLGRRKRSEDENTVTVPEKNAAVVEFLQESPWAFLALKGKIRNSIESLTNVKQRQFF